METIKTWTAADWIGVIGAIGTFFLYLLEYYKLHLQKPRLKVNYSTNQELLDFDGYGRRTKPSKETYWSVNVINPTDKPIVVKRVGFNNKKGNDSILTKCVEGTVQKHTLAAGDSESYTIAYSLVHPKTVKRIVIEDATGKKYKKRVRVRD